MTCIQSIGDSKLILYTGPTLKIGNIIARSQKKDDRTGIIEFDLTANNNYFLGFQNDLGSGN